MSRCLLTLVDNKNAYSASSSLLTAILGQWDEDNRARILRKYRECDRWDSVIAGLLVTRDASVMTSIPVTHLSWRREERTAKPYLYNEDRSRVSLCLSVTHEEGKIASLCADDSLSKDIGIDLIGTSRCLAIASNEKTLRGISRKFTQQMQEDIFCSSDAASRGKKFGMYWSLLESIAKLNTDGIHGETTRSMFHSSRATSLSPLSLTIQQSNWTDIVADVFPSLAPELTTIQSSTSKPILPMQYNIGHISKDSNDEDVQVSNNVQDSKEAPISTLQTFTGNGWRAWSIHVKDPFDAIVTISAFS